MNLISLAMDGLLAVLLLTAVGVGLRVNGKLKLLREGQGQFVRAVGDLDAAAARAEAGLAALRSATEEAHDALLTRIETARGLIPRIEQACEDAAGAGLRLEERVRAADTASRRAPPTEAPVRPSAASVEPIPFPTIRREPAAVGLLQALAAAERIAVVEAPAARASLPEQSAVRATTRPDGRLARFVARRQGARP